MAVIRAAREADVAVIHQLIRELAEYERLSHAVEATEGGLGVALFGPRPYAEVLLAEVPPQVAGFALFFPTYSTFRGQPGVYLEDLFVRPEFRGRGVGKALLAWLAVARGCGLLQWSVLNWNES